MKHAEPAFGIARNGGAGDCASQAAEAAARTVKIGWNRGTLAACDAFRRQTETAMTTVCFQRSCRGAPP